MAAGVDCLVDGVATHRMEVLKEASAAGQLVLLFSLETTALTGLVGTPLDAPTGGGLAWFIGLGTPLDCFGGVVSFLRCSCLGWFAVGLGSILAGLGT